MPNKTLKKFETFLGSWIDSTNNQYETLCAIHNELNPKLQNIIQIGIISKKVQNILDLYHFKEIPILISKSNYKHIMEKHPKDFIDFVPHIRKILSNPDYVGVNMLDDSIEYIKKFKTENKFVKVAIRVSTNKKFFVRSMYSVPEYKIKKLIKIGRLKKVD